EVAVAHLHRRREGGHGVLAGAVGAVGAPVGEGQRPGVVEERPGAGHGGGAYCGTPEREAGRRGRLGPLCCPRTTTAPATPPTSPPGSPRWCAAPRPRSPWT